MSTVRHPAASPGPVTLHFDRFWAWISAHPNCIVRAGTPDVLLFDHDDYHWHLAVEDERTCVVQLARGKELVGELVMFVEDIAYVHCEMSENEEFICECIIEAEGRRDAAYQFVMAHGYDETESPGRRRWTH
jgi:hypothetical protein